MDQHIFDSQYATFCFELLQKTELEVNRKFEDLSEPSLQVVRILVVYFTKLLIHSKEKQLIVQFGDLLRKNIFERSVPACRYFLQFCTRLKLRNLLLEPTIKEPRQAALAILSLTIKQVLPFEAKSLVQSVPGEITVPTLLLAEGGCTHMLGTRTVLVLSKKWCIY